MIPALRQETILNILSNNEIVNIDYLMEKLNISISTLRRDLTKLEQENAIILLHGGGVKLCPKPIELSITTKLDLNKEAKERIARKAASFVEYGDVIFLDPSSTTYLMIPYLVNRDITVLTNGISHITQLLNRDIPCLMIGGSIKKNDKLMHRPHCREYHAEPVFQQMFSWCQRIQHTIRHHEPRH